MQRRLRNVQKRVMHMQSFFLANINLFLFAVLLSSLSLWSKNFATMVTWHHTSPLHTHCEPLLRRECHHEFWEACAPGGRVLLMPLESEGGRGGYSSKFYTGTLSPQVQPLDLLQMVEPFWHASLESCIPFNCHKCIVFQIWINHY